MNKSKNELGVISETYHKLQSIEVLEKASLVYKVSNTSSWATIKAILQSVEIGILNINELVSRINKDLNNNEIGNAIIKLGWIKDINRLLIKLTNSVQILMNEKPEIHPQRILKVESNSKLELLIKRLDNSILNFIKINNISLNNFLENSNLDNVLYRFFHYYRIIAYELTLWNDLLTRIPIPNDTCYENFIGLKFINRAVNNPKLKGDNFFTQFRCIHQVPEILTVVINNNLEQAILSLREERLFETHKYINTSNIILKIVLDSLNPIINNLSQNDYHKIRENLGLTSGSHSINLHFHLFRDLYSTITSEFMRIYFNEINEYTILISNNYPLKLIEIELLKLRTSVNEWRNFHLNLPRINLGENQTRSLIGAKDAIESAKKMQIASKTIDPLNIIADIYFPQNSIKNSSLIKYIESEKSFDKILGKTIGDITQNRFSDVQNREGYFSKIPDFKRPNKRKI